MYSAIEEIDTEIRSKVNLGASWMDENHPGWVNSINLKALRMNNCSNCIIGQAVGDYYNTLVLATGDDEYDSDEWAIDRGFQSPTFYKNDDDYQEINFEKEFAYYRDLDDLWTDQVLIRIE